MPDYPAIEKKIQQVLGGTCRPIAIAFVDSPPAGVVRFEGSEPSSCSLWRLAAAGRTFYTVPADHQNCPQRRDERRRSRSLAHHTFVADRPGLTDQRSIGDQVSNDQNNRMTNADGLAAGFLLKRKIRYLRNKPGGLQCV